jgi:hypothetical protein
MELRWVLAVHCRALGQAVVSVWMVEDEHEAEGCGVDGDGCEVDCSAGVDLSVPVSSVI